jgi:hypothetical protein
LTIKLDGNLSSFQVADSIILLSVTDSAIAPSARMHELRAIRVPSRNETSKAAKTLRATEHTSSMPLRAARVGQQRLLGKGSHETKALSHTHKHTHDTHAHRSVYAVTVSCAKAQAFSCTHLPEALPRIYSRTDHAHWLQVNHFTQPCTWLFW